MHQQRACLTRASEDDRLSGRVPGDIELSFAARRPRPCTLEDRPGRLLSGYSRPPAGSSRLDNHLKYCEGPNGLSTDRAFRR